MKERLGLPELVAMAKGAPDDAAKHVTPALIAGNHAIDHQERTGPDVVGDHFQGIGCEVPGMRLARRRPNQILENVDFII